MKREDDGNEDLKSGDKGRNGLFSAMERQWLDEG
jgi:hypothetical protein